MPLAPSAKDLKPWYVSGVHDALDTEQEGEKAFEERRYVYPAQGLQYNGIHFEMSLQETR